MRNFLFPAVFLLLAAIPAQAENAQESIKRCQGSKATPGGQMPWGATDADLRSYKGKNVCTYSEGRPIGANCKRTVEKLYEVGSRINGMVKTGCAKYMPLFVTKSALASCVKGQRGCTDAGRAQLVELKAEIGKFKAELARFTEVLNERQSYVVKHSRRVSEVLDENERARSNPTVYSQPSAGAAEMGKSTISESDEYNGRQDAAYARSLLQNIQETFQDSDKRYADVTEENYNQKLQPITESFQKVHKLKSKVMREQLHGFLKAEELKLATRLYDNQLEKLSKTTNEFIETNETNAEKTGSLPSNMGALAALAPLAASAFNKDQSGVTTPDYNPTFSPNPTPDTPGTDPTKLDGDVTGKSGKPAPLDGTKGVDAPEIKLGGISHPGASRYPSSLRDSIRKKLGEQAGGSGGTLGVSTAGASLSPGEADGAKASGADATAGIRSAEGDVPVPMGGGAPEGNLAAFGTADLKDGAFNIEGSTTEASVNALVDEFRAALGMDDDASPEIGGADGPTLFSRVKEFHVRCQKRGCVLGKTRESL